MLKEQRVAEDGLTLLEQWLGTEKLKIATQKLQGMSYRRESLINELAELEKSNLLSQNWLARLNSARHALQRNLKDSELIGALRDVCKVVNCPSQVAKDGWQLKHLKEVADGLKSLSKLHEALVWQIKSYKPETWQYRKLQKMGERVGRLIKSIEKYLGVEIGGDGTVKIKLDGPDWVRRSSDPNSFYMLLK